MVNGTATPAPSGRKGDGCLMSYQATGLVKTLVRPHGEFGARREPKSFAIGPLDLIFRKASEFHDR